MRTISLIDFFVFWTIFSIYLFCIHTNDILKTIPGLKINGEEVSYGVFNEREIRATAGIMMLVGIATFFVVFFQQDFLYLYPTLFLFLVQFSVAVIRGVDYAPFSMLARILVSNQKPEYVGAIQKRFARSLGLGMGIIMLVVVGVFGMTGAVPLSICMTCLVLMRMESTLGICVGCKMYYGLINLGRISEPKQRPACPGGACSISKPH